MTLTTPYEPLPWVTVDVQPASIALHCSRCRSGALVYHTVSRKDPGAVKAAHDQHRDCQP